MVDGRPVYTPTFGGVFWDQLDLPLEDIDRIEVIRGPGGTVWGANAVHGVISSITKTSQHTQVWIVVAGGRCKPTRVHRQAKKPTTVGTGRMVASARTGISRTGIRWWYKAIFSQTAKTRPT